MQGNVEVERLQKPKRIGIVLGSIGDLNVSVLQFLVLRLNSLQKSFEYEFLPNDPIGDSFLQMLRSNSLVDRKTVRGGVTGFLGRYQKYLEDFIRDFHLKESRPNYFVVITLARFDDQYYSMRENRISVLALGNWERRMAPPSIFEFVLTLILRESVAVVSPSLRSSIHLGTKGCLLDFTPSLGDARFKALNGFICNHCREALQSDGFADLSDELVRVLKKKWLGKSFDPSSPAGIVSKLGYDLFMTRGLKPTLRERVLAGLQETAVKQLLQIVGGIVLAALLVWLGLKKP